VTAGYQAGTSGAMVEPARVGVVNITGSIVPPAAADTAGSAYKIGPLDVLEVSVFKVPELSRSVQVAEAGTVNLPLVGEIPAAGRTAQEIERDLTRQLGAKYLQKPQVTVYIKEYNSQRVTVEGAVKKPGVFPFQGRGTLLQSIAMAEGLDTTRASTDVVVFRVADGRRRAAKFDVEAIRAGHVVDPALQAGDVVVVHDSSAKIAFNNILRILPAGGAFVGLF
jgi:polysaccharide export outer membrane protein